jgi:pimeloyl-ACP methyl ester carboxylesterase
MLALVLLVLLVLATHQGRVALLSLAILPSAVGVLPVDPLASLTPKPEREPFAFDYAGGTVEGDVYSPGGSGRHGALILILGARPVDRDDPTLVRFAEGLGRIGIVVLIPSSSGLAGGHILPEEVDAVVNEVELLRARPDVDPPRIGILGFSVGGSVAIQAAADPRLADKLILVNAFGSYNDATDLVRAAATRSLSYAGVDEAWEPHPLTLWVLARQLVDTLPDATDRDVIDRLHLQADSIARADVDLMTPVGRAALGILDGLPRSEVEQAIAALPPATIARLNGISPSRVLDRVTTRLFVMHDRGDHFVPYTESRRMAAQVPPEHLAQFAEFDLFDHVMPDRPPTSLSFYIELARLFRQLYGVLLYVV